MRRIAGFHSWLKELPETVRRQVLGRMRPRDYAPGAAVWHLGDLASECYLIQSGRVRLSNYSYAGKEVQIVEFRAGVCGWPMRVRRMPVRWRCVIAWRAWWRGWGSAPVRPRRARL